MDIALLFEGLEMRTYTVGRADTQRFTNLADAWWDTCRAHLTFDIIENFSLSFCELWSLSCCCHGRKNAPCAPWPLRWFIPAHMSNTAHLGRCQAENVSTMIMQFDELASPRKVKG